jgi:hypothetical protein
VVVATLTVSACQFGPQDVRWSSPGQSLARSVVDAVLDRLQIGCAERAQVAALGEVLAEESVGVLVRSA